MHLYIPWWTITGFLLGLCLGFWILISIETIKNPKPMLKVIRQTTQDNLWKWYPGFMILVATVISAILFYFTV